MHVVDGIYQGTRTHVLEVFSRVVAISPEIDFVLFADRTEALANSSKTFSLPNVQLVRMPHANPAKRLLWQFPRLAREYRLALLHMQYIVPPISPCATMTTIHDILFESHPQYFTRGFRLRSKLLMRLSARRSAHVFTVSDFSSRAIQELYQVPAASLTVIPNGVDRTRFCPGTSDEETVRRFGLKPRNYVLSVGRLEPRKNHITLFEAYAGCKTELPLVVVGQIHFSYKSAIDRASELGLLNRILFLNDVTDAQLPALYRHAKLFVYPTWAEGFGMPLLEAMASGVPVVSSDNTAIPDVVGEAGLLVDAGDVVALRSAIDCLLHDESIARNCTNHGLERAAQFTWDRAAELIRKQYLDFLRLRPAAIRNSTAQEIET